MNRWIVVFLVGLAGCEGERVDALVADAQSPDAASPDVASQEAGDAPVTGDCGDYRGAAMVRVGAFCIDTTEVTRKQFLDFLAAPVAERNAAKPADCKWNTTDPPITATPAALGFPVGEVNFCDALAYCAWAKKRLCGRIGGGALDPANSNKAGESEWFAVCSVNGAQTYAYPGTYSRAKCFTEEATVDATGTRTTCAGAEAPYSNVFDLIGNAMEWENSCTAALSGETSTRCRTRGGNYGSGAAAECVAKDTPTSDLTTINTRLPGIGFRCCKD
jgi:formylglycine-generating enzyme required for sulfatase activity